jgi:isoquinoline 1-oxidoreductase beta subunit
VSEAPKLISRRTFLHTFGLTTAGLYFGVYALGATKPTTEPAGSTGPKPKTSAPEEEKTSIGLNPNVFVHVAPDGLVTIVCHRSEMGQGIRSSLPVLLADELGADMKRVKIVQGDGDKAYGDQNTDGSNSVRGIYEDMRRAAATARVMLVAAAAARLKVPANSLETRDHFVVQKGTSKKIAFGDLAVEAGKMEIPQPADVKFRPDKELRRVGKALPLLDGPAYVNGTAPFGADIRLPDMLIAVIARPPVMGATVDKFNEKAALGVAGVKKVVKMPEAKAPYGFQPYGGVAVVAENTWAAMQGRDALAITWDKGSHGNYTSATYREELLTSVRKPGTVMRNVGDADEALAKAARRVEAEYYVPHLPHVAMEPLSAIARYSKENGGRCEVWAPTQNPQAAMTEVGRALGIPEDHVTVHVTFLGGGFGRKSKADFCSEAALLAKEMGVPVRVQWTRTDDIHNDYLNAVNAQSLAAGLDEKGKLIAWRHRTAFPPIGSTFDSKVNEPGSGDLQQGVLDVALAVPNVRAEACKANVHARIGWLRSVYNIFHAFAVNSFIDEIAHARKQDPKAAMLEIYGPARKISLAELGVKDLKNYGQSLEKHPVDAGRLRGVIERVTEVAGWDKRKSKKGRAFGLAAHRSFNSYTAVVASVTKKKNGALWVDEVWIAVDAGTIINPDRVRAQMEGSVINGMSYILHAGVTHKDGAVEQNNYDGVKIVRMAEAPRKIHVEILRTPNAPGGVGEPGLPPVAPAVANAIFALTGKRMREFGLEQNGLA